MLDMTPGAVRFRLTEILKERNMKQRELAQKMGVFEQTVSQLTGGIKSINLTTLARLCDALDVEVGELLVYEPERKEES